MTSLFMSMVMGEYCYRGDEYSRPMIG